MPTSTLIKQALHHLDIPVRPENSHIGCRHHRWADSYLFLFEVMTILALRMAPDSVTIWNGDGDQLWCEEQERFSNKKEHPGYFEIDPIWTNDPRILICGDGRLLDGSERNLWEEFMSGVSPSDIADELEIRINKLKQ